jgi:hypothetical protein
MNVHVDPDLAVRKHLPFCPLVPLLRLDAQPRDQHGGTLQLDVEQHLMV